MGSSVASGLGSSRPESRKASPQARPAGPGYEPENLRITEGETGRPSLFSLSVRACNPVGGWLPIEVGFGLTERGRAGAEAGMACEVGGGAGARRDYGVRGRAH